jgi:hypothetical protein
MVMETYMALAATAGGLLCACHARATTLACIYNGARRCAWRLLEAEGPATSVSVKSPAGPLIPLKHSAAACRQTAQSGPPHSTTRLPHALLVPVYRPLTPPTPTHEFSPLHLILKSLLTHNNIIKKKSPSKNLSV